MRGCLFVLVLAAALARGDRLVRPGSDRRRPLIGGALQSTGYQSVLDDDHRDGRPAAAAPARPCRSDRDRRVGRRLEGAPCPAPRR